MPPVSPGEAGVSPHAPPRPTPQNQGGNAPGLMAELEGVPGFAGCEPQVQATGRGMGISNIYPKVKQVGPGGHYKQLPLALYKQRDASHHRGGLGNPRGGRASPRTAAPAPSPPGLCCADPTPGWDTDRPQLPQGLAGSKPQPPPSAGHTAWQLPAVRGSRSPRRLCSGRERGWAAPSRDPQGEDRKLPGRLGLRWPGDPPVNSHPWSGGQTALEGKI